VEQWRTCKVGDDPIEAQLFTCCYQLFKYFSDLKCKNPKLQSCRSCRELQCSYKNHFHPSSYEKDIIFLRWDLIVSAGVAWQDWTVTQVGVAWQAWHVEYTLADPSCVLQHGTLCHGNACGATCLCTGATKRVRFKNICSDGIFLK
jgi:hypothetical protein